MADSPDSVELHARELFASAGLALYRAQLLEKRLADFLVLPKGAEGITREEYEAIRVEHHGRTFGTLINRLKQHPGAEELVKVLEARLEDRNRLAHRFFYERGENMMSREGRDALIRELHDMAQRFLDANKVLRRVMFAWIKARGAPEADVEQTLRRMREERGLPAELPPHLE